jgi:hypothetical protein
MLRALVCATHYREMFGYSMSRKQHLNLREATACCDEAAANLESFY